MPFNLTKVDSKTFIGHAIVNAENEKSRNELIFDQMKDNFCAMLCVIGYENMEFLRPGLIATINKTADNLLV